jgi:S-adenosylmethionine:diacylglycerol 3-amino-3-carboxypropyl transferase
MLFAQTREDPMIELDIIDRIDKINNFDLKLNILCVTSGGCTVLSMLSDKINKIDAIDINISQNYLCELKVGVCKYYHDNIYNILKFYQGSFEKHEFDEILYNLDISDNCKNYWKGKIYEGINRTGKFEELFRFLVENNMDFERAFDRDYLTTIFGQNAVIYSKNKEFYDHFKNVFEIYEKLYKPEENYFYYQVLYDTYPKNNLPYYLTHLTNIAHYHKINYINADYFNYIKFVPNYYYDIVQTSNLTDWMNNNDLTEFMKNLYSIVKSKGYIIMRRLNGDYKLRNIVSEYFEIIDSLPIEKSHFYSEVIVAQKR